MLILRSCFCLEDLRRQSRPPTPVKVKSLAPILTAQFRSDDSTSIKPDIILTVWFGSGRSGACLRLRSVGGPGRLVRLAPRSLTSLACWSARARVYARAHLLRSNLGHWSTIVRSRSVDTPSRGRFAKEPLGFPRINPPYLVFIRRPLYSCNQTPDLLINHVFRPNFVF
jgi:hypothetical protein